MPVVLFTCGTFLGLLLFHRQTEIPSVWFWLENQFPAAFISAFVLLLGLGALAVLSRRYASNGLRRTGLSQTSLLLLLIPVAGVHLLAGPVAAERLNKRVAIECHQTVHSGQFEIEAIGFLPEGARKWTLSVIHAQGDPTPSGSDSNCLKKGAKLSLVVDPHLPTKNKELLSQMSAGRPGQHVQATLQIKAPKSTLQMHGFDVQAHWFAHGISGLASMQSLQLNEHQPHGLSPLKWIQRLRFSTGTWITQTLDNHPQQGLVLALVTGDQGLISPEDREVFNNTGIAHLVAISGLHITMLAGLSSWLVSLLWRRHPRLAELLPAGMAGQSAGLAIALLYGLLAGWGVPAQRTVWMQAGFLIVRLHPGRGNVWTVYGSAMLLSLLMDPWVIFDIGFYLSFGAVGLLIYSVWGYTTFPKGHPNLQERLSAYIHASVKAQYVATVGLVPLCAALFHQQSFISPLVNALSIPWMSFISTPLCMLGTLTGNSWLLHAAAQSLEFQTLWLNAPASSPLATWSLPRQPEWTYAVAAAGVLWILLPRGILPRWPGLLAMACLLWPLPKPQQAEFWLDVLDVGQGTAVVVRTQHHSLLYDTGPAFNAQSNSARRVILPWLKSEGVTQLDQVWLSHDDADHTGGAMVLLQNHQPKQLVSHLAINHALIQQANAIQAQNLDCKTLQPWEWDGVRFTPISPPSASDHAMSNPSVSKELLKDNNQSCMLKIQSGRHKVLLTGDIELAAEKALLETIRHGAQHVDDLTATLLYAPHHGSKTSSSQAFLNAVKPDNVIIQSGWRNKYRHPHPEVLDRYRQMNINTLQTAQIGALHVRLNPESKEIRVESALQNRLRYWHLHESSAFKP